jgi:hypothetical protein
VKPYSVVFQNQMIILFRRSLEEAMAFAIQQKGDQWKYATVTELEALDVYSMKNSFLIYEFKREG